jgi:oxygen-independent coproporphyrinogen III oxidase
MPHLYLHIPFCRQACHYCDFHFSTTQSGRNELLRAMLQEIDMRAYELPKQALETIYFGGGTPSLLTAEELNAFFAAIEKKFEILTDAEITLEANPDDLTETYLRELKATQVNRLSIGIQSFREQDLKQMNRAHTATQAREAVRLAQQFGFNNITVDLIYGIPDLTDADWEKNLHEVFELGVQHLSAYCLTVEPRTPLAHFVKTGKAKPIDEEQAGRQFQLLCTYAAAHGFEQYEISNFATMGFSARHNSSYWKSKPYLGIGPSAHSFDGKARRWNVSNNAVYTQAVEQGEVYFESEELTLTERYNEYVMTRLRTSWGCDLNEIENMFGVAYRMHVLKEAEPYIAQEALLQNDQVLVLSASGKLIADKIASDLFY